MIEQPTCEFAMSNKFGEFIQKEVLKEVLMSTKAKKMCQFTYKNTHRLTYMLTPTYLYISNCKSQSVLNKESQCKLAGMCSIC